MDPFGFLHQDYVGHAFERLVTKRHVAVGEIIVWHGAERQVDVHIVQRPCPRPRPLHCELPCALGSLDAALAGRTPNIGVDLKNAP